MTDKENANPIWGYHFNEFYISRRKKEPLSGCPTWASAMDIDEWCKPGIIVWSELSKKVENLSGARSIELLEKLEASKEWETEGIKITRRYLVQHGHTQEVRRRKKKKDKATQEKFVEPEITEPKPASEELEEEILYLPPEAGLALITLLEEHRRRLEEMAENDRKEAQRRLREVYKQIIDLGIKADIDKLDIPHRTFRWEVGNKPYRWICEQPPNEAVIFRPNKILWQSCIRHNGRYSKSNVFYEVEEAFQWAENELAQLQTTNAVPETNITDDLRAREEASSRLIAQLVADPASIRPDKMEPESIHYQVFIEVFAKPETFKTIEDPCGDPMVMDESYLSPNKMAILLNLDPDHYTIQPKNVQSFGWYLFCSVVNYHLDTLAIMQAQKAWDESRVMHEYKIGKVIRARYGYRETETGYFVVLGSCDSPDKPWEKQSSRADHMAELAAKETLCLRLNVNDYRTFLGFLPTTTSDMQLLSYMHKGRSTSKFANEDARRESRIWLAEHAGEINR